MKISSLCPSVKSYLVLFVVLLISISSYSQKIEDLSDAQVREFVKRAEASGMSESEIEKYAMARGYSAADVLKLRDRINKLKSNNTADKSAINVKESNTNPREVEGEQKDMIKKVGDKPIIDQEEKDEINQAKAELPSKPNQSSRALALYGSTLFNRSNLNFEPNLRIPTPKNYILGADDELLIDIFGNSQMAYKAKISPEGTVKLENLAPIFVNGLTIDQASERIINRLKQIYYGLNTQGGGVFAQVTLGNIRSIKVTVIGEAVKPGSYTVPSLATIFNVLYQAGGPSGNGSYRNIQLIRDNKIVRTLDLYDFLLKADQSDNLQVKDQDVIKINDYDKRVYITGEVKRPAIYEVKKGETFKTILGYAGNFAEKAYQKSIKLKRYTDTEQKIIELYKNDFATLIPEAGDKFQVDSVLNTFENRVIIRGAVKRPGEFALGTGIKTLKDLIAAAEGLTDDAFTSRATITREGQNLQLELIAFDVEKLLKGESNDIELKKEDNVDITFVQNIKENYTVSIYGQVNKPDVYPFKQNMTIADLVSTAGGFKDAAMSSKIELSRRVKYDSVGTTAWQTVKISEFNINENLAITGNDEKYRLMPFDVVAVKSSPRYEAQKNVILVGEVVYPGYYILEDNEEKLSDLIERAGGIKPAAFLRGGRIFRNNQIVSVNFENAIKNASSLDNVSILKGDSIYIPKVSQTVEINGGVFNPALVTFKAGENLKQYIAKAGGLMENGMLNLSYVIYPNGESDRTTSIFGIKKYPKIEPGSQIFVPFKDEGSKRKVTGPEITTMATALVSTVSIILTTLRFLKQ